MILSGNFPKAIEPAARPTKKKRRKKRDLELRPSNKRNRPSILR